MRFELEGSYTLGLIPSDFDTIAVAVREPDNIFDYLRISEIGKSAADKGLWLSITRPTWEFSHFTNDTAVTLEGSVSKAATYGMIHWDVVSAQGTDTGSFAVTGNEWKGLAVTFRTDNWEG